MTSLIELFDTISLEQMARARLMNRIDTKYILCREQLFDFLPILKNNYLIQCNATNGRIAKYETIYFDTVDKNMYLMHETGRTVRKKVRIRTYLDTRESYIECKFKNNHGGTCKKRTQIPFPIQNISDSEVAKCFVEETCGFNAKELIPTLRNEFHRMTLVSKDMDERLTVDFDLCVQNLVNKTRVGLSDLVVIELKRNSCSSSFAKQKMIECGIRPSSFSKYCVGLAMTDDNIRKNNLKEKINKIKKIM